MNPGNDLKTTYSVTIIYWYIFPATFSDRLFGANQVRKTPNLLIKPTTTSRFFLNILFTAIAATSSALIFNFSPAFIAFFPMPALTPKLVSTPPGETQVTDIFVFFNSCCNALEKLTTKDLLAE